MGHKGHTPQRTCVACRTKTDAADLLCVVRGDTADGDVQLWVGGAPARRHRPAGRGAWICPAASCLDRAFKANAFFRAFRGAFFLPEAPWWRVQCPQWADTAGPVAPRKKGPKSPPTPPPVASHGGG